MKDFVFLQKYALVTGILLVLLGFHVPWFYFAAPVLLFVGCHGVKYLLQFTTKLL